MRPSVWTVVTASSFFCFAISSVCLGVVYGTAEHEFAVYNVAQSGVDEYVAIIVNKRRSEAVADISFNCNTTATITSDNCHDNDNDDDTPDVCPTSNVVFSCTNEGYIAMLTARTDEKFEQQQSVALYVFIPLLVISFLAFGAGGFMLVNHASASAPKGRTGFF